MNTRFERSRLFLAQSVNTIDSFFHIFPFLAKNLPMEAFLLGNDPNNIESTAYNIFLITKGDSFE